MSQEIETVQAEEMPTELNLILKDSGLELSETETIKQSYLPYFTQMAEIKEQAKKINFENPSELDEKIARELRLKTVKIRTGSLAIKDERKRIHTLKANIEQSTWNLIKASCELEEETFLQVEKVRINKEIARKAALKAERLELLAPITDQANIYPVGEMTEESFQDLLSGLQLAAQAKIEAAQKAEAERIERERKEAEEREAQRLENIRLKAEAEAREKELAAEREEAEKARLAQEALRKAEQAKADKILADQKAEAERKQKEIEDKAAAERKLEAEMAAKVKAEADTKLEAERKENERLQAQLKTKQEAEEKARIEKEDAEKKRIAAEKKAAAAPKKQKLSAWVDGFVIDAPTGLSEDETVKNILAKFESFKAWSKSEIEKID